MKSWALVVGGADLTGALHLTTLELRQLHYDLVMCYKIIFNIVNMESADFFVLNTVSFTRGHPYKLYVNHCRTNVRRNFFACRIVKVWNSLPTDRVDFLVHLVVFVVHCIT